MRKSRRAVALAALGAIVVGATVGAVAAQSWIQAPGGWRAGPAVQNQAYFPTRRCMNMGGALEAPREGEWGYSIRERDFATVRAAGFDTVRIPIKWSAHAATTPPYAIDPAFFARIDEVMTWALSAGLNVIVNVHHYDELYADPDRHEPRLDALWAQIAHRYQRTPPGVMFEIVNEPRDAFSGERVNLAQARALSIIRRTNPTRTVILTGDRWGGPDGMDNLRLPADPYVIATVHYYGPYEFTHQGAEWMKNPPPSGRTWPRPGERAEMAREVDRMAAWRARLGVPVLMGEYGTDTAVPVHLRASWARDARLEFERVGMPACYFNFAAGFGIYDTRTERWNGPILEALGLRPR